MLVSSWILPFVVAKKRLIVIRINDVWINQIGRIYAVNTKDIQSFCRCLKRSPMVVIEEFMCWIGFIIRIHRLLLNPRFYCDNRKQSFKQVVVESVVESLTTFELLGYRLLRCGIKYWVIWFIATYFRFLRFWMISCLWSLRLLHLN